MFAITFVLGLLFYLGCLILVCFKFGSCSLVLVALLSVVWVWNLSVLCFCFVFDFCCVLWFTFGVGWIRLFCLKVWVTCLWLFVFSCVCFVQLVFVVYLFVGLLTFCCVVLLRFVLVFICCVGWLLFVYLFCSFGLFWCFVLNVWFTSIFLTFAELNYWIIGVDVVLCCVCLFCW